MSSLDLYADIEDLLCFDEQIGSLHSAYMGLFEKYKTKKLIDIGCGSGSFAVKAQNNGLDVLGVDLSANMVAKAASLGVKAKCIDICKIDERFDSACAVFDVLNYIPADSLKEFLSCVENLLLDGGYFFADINTLHGFRDVAVGSICFNDDKRELIIEADFDDEKLQTSMKLFELQSNGLYSKKEGQINQFYHKTKDIASATKMKLVEKIKVSLYGNGVDKELLIFKK